MHAAGVHCPQVANLETQVAAAIAAVQEFNRKTQPLEEERAQRIKCAAPSHSLAA